MASSSRRVEQAKHPTLRRNAMSGQIPMTPGQVTSMPSLPHVSQPYASGLTRWPLGLVHSGALSAVRSVWAIRFKRQAKSLRPL